MIGGALSRFGAFVADAFGPSADQCPLYAHQKQNSDRAQYLHNSRLCWRSLDLAHVPVVHGGHLTIVPGDRDCIPTHFGDNAAISGITSPINAAALLKTSRFSGVHRPLVIVAYHRQMSF